jgi:hypothetical protein
LCELKFCSGCKTDLPILAFSKNQHYCKTCQKVRRNKKRSEDLEAARGRDLAAYYKNYENRLLSKRKYRENNREKSRKADLARQKMYPERYAARAAMRRAYKKGCTPKWANESLMLAVYAKARELSIGSDIKYEVDHIVPLKSDLVCGFHCEDNLQILSESENRIKSNRYWPDMPEELDEQN